MTQAQVWKTLDPYQALQVDPRAPHELIDEAYWFLVARAKLIEAPAIREARIRELTDAYARLANPDRRRAYDEQNGIAESSDGLNAPARYVASHASLLMNQHCQILGVNPDAEAGVIDLAFSVQTRRVARGRPNEKEVRRRLEEAHRILSDPAGRAVCAGSFADGSTLLRARPDGGAASQPAASDLVIPHVRVDPALSASRVLSREQLAVGLALVIAIVAGLIWSTTATLIGLISVAAVFYTVTIVYKSLLVIRSLSSPSEFIMSDEELASLNDVELPVYTILLPVYREAEVLRDLIRSIEALDYPKEKLDVKLLFEEDDPDTRAAAEKRHLPSYFELLTVPSTSEPTGKPRACNHGLSRARGEFVALYDAEDRPEPDQLKKALVAFRRNGSNVACVQAKLNYYNPNQNLITKWFTVEYSTWFDLYLPGLNSLAAPIPLGGTSNHFRVDVLCGLGAWDSFNVTEDADLGMRLARGGYRTLLIDSTTYEEANSRLGNWLRQRSRWVKGYMQTWLVHMRDPRRLLRELGPHGFLAFQAMVLGTFFAYFVNPIFWALLLIWYATHAAGIQALYPGPLLYLSAAALFIGNFLLILVAVAGCLRRGFYEGVKYALLNHVYWALMSVASWKALWQLIVRPHYWEKTRHGLGAAHAVPQENRLA